MKVRDLLRKIVNGEDLPQKIKINNDIYVLNNLKYLDEIYAVEDTRWQYYNFSLIDYYDNEVEIIEEDKKIRKLDFVEENTFSKRQNGMTSEDRRLLDSNFRELGIKINEIIDKINKEK